MNKKFYIKEMFQSPTESGCDVTFKLDILGKEWDLNYKIEGGEIHSVPELCDSVVVTFLIYALEYGFDFESTIPMSEDLYYNVVEQIIPQIQKCDTKAKKIAINVPRKNEIFNGDINATGVSLGVDSFAAIKEYMSEELPEHYRITHLVHLRVGAHHGGRTYKDTAYEEQLFLEENKKVKEYCQKTNKKLITIQSNLYDITCSEFSLPFEPSHLFRNMAAILLVQNRIKRYYYGSSQSLSNFYIDIKRSSAAYERWVIAYLSTQNVTLRCASGNMTRSEKVEYLLDFKDTYDFLHVCWMNEKNCGECNKCIRTLLQLDMFDALDLYKNVFDIDKFNRKKKWYWTKAAAIRRVNSSYNVLLKDRKARGLKMPNPFAVFCVKIQIILTNLLKLGPKYVIERIKVKH